MTEAEVENRGEAQGRDRHWWVKMLVTSAALAAVLLGLYFIGPIARVHYHGWRYRTGRGREASLAVVADWAVRHALSETNVCRLLGRPNTTPHIGEAGYHELSWWATPVKAREGDMLCYIYFEKGRAVRFEVVPGKW